MLIIFQFSSYKDCLQHSKLIRKKKGLYELSYRWNGSFFYLDTTLFLNHNFHIYSAAISDQIKKKSHNKTLLLETRKGWRER